MSLLFFPFFSHPDIHKQMISVTFPVYLQSGDPTLSVGR